MRELQRRQQLRPIAVAELIRRGEVVPSELLLSPFYRNFQERYRNEPADFVADCFAWPAHDRPAEYQLEILSELMQHKRLSARGLHGLGKTALSAWLIHWFALTRDGSDWKVVTTASVWRQLTKYLWPEVHKWARLIKWERVGRAPYNLRTELQTLSLNLTTGQAFAVASDDHTAIEGAHADHLLYLFDEAKAIKDATFDAAEGAFSNASDGREAYAVAISTPGEPMGRFFDIHTRKPGYLDWHTRHITLDEAIRAGRVSEEWAEARKLQWGESSPLYINRVLGEFAATSTDGVIPLSYVEAAIERWRAWRDKGGQGRLTTIGADIATGHGGDSICLATCFDLVKVFELIAWDKGDPLSATMEIVGRIVGILTKHKSGEAIVDYIGVGTGVLDRLRELRMPARGFIASAGTTLMDKGGQLRFANWRSASWWILREMLEDPSFGVCLPDDDRLVGELTAPSYKIISDGVIQVEAKESIKRRLSGRSTDYADAVIMALVGPLLCDQAVRDNQGGQSQVIYSPIQIGDY